MKLWVRKSTPFINQPLALAVEVDSKWAIKFLEPVADLKFAELKGVAVPADCKAVGPLPVGHGSRIQRHPDVIVNVVAGTRARAKSQTGPR